MTILERDKLIADVDAEPVNLETELFEGDCETALLESENLAADVYVKLATPEAVLFEDGPEVMFLENDKPIAYLAAKLGDPEAVLFEDECEGALLESDKVFVDIATVDEVPIEFDVVEGAVSPANEMFAVEDVFENVYNAEVSDDGEQIPMVLEEVEVELIELPLEAKSPETQGSVENALDLDVEAEAIIWRASRLICRSGMDNMLSKRRGWSYIFFLAHQYHENFLNWLPGLLLLRERHGREIRRRATW